MTHGTFKRMQSFKSGWALYLVSVSVFFFDWGLFCRCTKFPVAIKEVSLVCVSYLGCFRVDTVAHLLCLDHM